MRIDPALLADCRSMILDIAPELRQQPLYVLAAAEVQPLLPSASTCYGFALAGSIEHAAFAEHLGSRWQGHGPVIVLDGRQMRDAARPGQFERLVRAVALHEAAHILPPAPTLDLPADISTPDLIAWQRRQLAEGLTAPPPPVDDPAHDAAFIRRAMHAYFRAIAAGYDLATDAVLTEHSRPEHYLPLIVQEALAMRDADFAAIEATEPPAALLEQFELDREHYRRMQTILAGEIPC